MKHTEVKTGEGLGEIKFGITRDQLAEILGQPDEKDGFSYEGEEESVDTEAWHYDQLEVSFSFDKDDDWRLGTIASSSPETTFGGEKVIDLDVDSLMNLLKNKGFENVVLEDLSTDDIPNHHVAVLEEESINFWFEDGELSEIQWSPNWEDEETIIWPN
jgi:hypothetical protein